MDSSEHVGFETSQVLKDVDAYSISVELLSWCRGILDRLDKLARDRLLARGNNSLLQTN